MGKNKSKTSGNSGKHVIVKRKGHFEEFSEMKVYGSCFAACLSAHVEHTQAEKIAAKVSRAVKTWAKKQGRVSTDDIFIKTAEEMRKLHEDAAFMYATHRDLC
ncbi:hypothetical protein J4212_01265 [Candidatus Woesearchaeota archaeon]|nr:hypothetical protein [Candidatus Woesearchaeota archaeon]